MRREHVRRVVVQVVLLAVALAGQLVGLGAVAVVEAVVVVVVAEVVDVGSERRGTEVCWSWNYLRPVQIRIDDSLDLLTYECCYSTRDLKRPVVAGRGIRGKSRMSISLYRPRYAGL